MLLLINCLLSGEILTTAHIYVAGCKAGQNLLHRVVYTRNASHNVLRIQVQSM